MGPARADSESLPSNRAQVSEDHVIHIARMREQRERIQDESAEHAGMQLNHESQNDFVASD